MVNWINHTMFASSRVSAAALGYQNLIPSNFQKFSRADFERRF